MIEKEDSSVLQGNPKLEIPRRMTLRTDVICEQHREYL